MTGVAINKEEYVPTTTPISKANIKPLITSPPKENIINKTKNVVKEVLTVLLKVLFRAELTNSLSYLEDVELLKYSLILSKTTTVSFRE